jgi:hypothetical protein
MPGWKERSDDEIRALAQEVLDGRVLGSQAASLRTTILEAR